MWLAWRPPLWGTATKPRVGRRPRETFLIRGRTLVILPALPGRPLNLPQGHQHRDEALARRAVRSALYQARLAGEHKTLLWATRRALKYEFGTEAECDEWLEYAERLTAEVDEPDERFLLWSAACDHLLTIAGRAVRRRGKASPVLPEPDGGIAQTPNDRALAWLQLSEIHVHMDAQSPACNCFEAGRRTMRSIETPSSRPRWEPAALGSARASTTVWSI